ncbi:MAG TPA: hypothetical protein VFZ66_23940 [Herpetosiphonaceae bacterium]
MKTRIFWSATTVLALAMIAQLFVLTREPSVLTVHASWAHSPKSFAEARQKAGLIIKAEVLASEQGPDDVITMKDGIVDRLPARHVTLRVLKSYKGDLSAGQTVTLKQTGGIEQNATRTQPFVLEGDPFYQVGEQYLLLLERGSTGVLLTISPEGRYQIGKSGALTPMVDNATTREVRGKLLANVEPQLR